MSFTTSIVVICLIACHGGPAAHFATYAEALAKKGFNIQIYASGPALNKFQERGIEVKYPFVLDNLSPEEEDSLAIEIAKTCTDASIIITEVGHFYDAKIQKALSENIIKIPRFAYYDNPEPFVPGGYSYTAAKVIEFSDGILFANKNLAKTKIYMDAENEIDFTNKTLIGIGYYPISLAEKIAEKRKTERDIIRHEFFKKNDIEESGQKILIYFGGNNEEYFTKAFPAFLSLLAEASKQVDYKNIVIVIQQHPGAKALNRDIQQIVGAEVTKIIVSDFSSDNAQVLADAAFYYQTSMGPQFILEGIPTFQIGHKTYEDILVSNHLASSVTSSEELVQVIQNLDSMKEMPKQDLLNSLGINEDWPSVLENIIKALIENY